MNFTLSTRHVGGKMIFGSRPVRNITTILLDGVYYADVPADADGQAIIDQMNYNASLEIQFKTEREAYDYANQNDAG